MTTIEFTVIPDTDADYDLQLALLAEFKKETGVEVKLTRMEWSDAWQQLINISTHGQGADISHVGSTWVSSLVSMNALRSIPSHVITKIGSQESFVHSAWESARMEDDRNAWAIPLSAGRPASIAADDNEFVNNVEVDPNNVGCLIGDHIHHSDAGGGLMADAWYEGLVQYLA